MNILFLDDCPIRTKTFKSIVPSATCVKTANEAISALATGVWDWVLLDHDLGGEIYVDSGREDSGMEVARWLAANPIDVSLIILHSLNAPARRAMHETLGMYKVLEIPFAWKIKELFI